MLKIGGTRQMIAAVGALAMLVWGAGAAGYLSASPRAAQENATISNGAVSIKVDPTSRTFAVSSPDGREVFRAGSSVDLEGGHVDIQNYTSVTTERSSFTDDLGGGEQLVTKFTGLAGKPDLERVLRVYRDSPFGSVTLRIANSTSSNVVVHSLRPINVSSAQSTAGAKPTATRPQIDLGGPEPRERVLEDSFSEDRPTERIYDLGKAPDYKSFDDVSDKLSGMHMGVGSQLIFNRYSGRDLFMGGLTSHRWLTVFHLATTTSPSGATVTSLTVDSTGTKEPEQHEALSRSKPADQMEASVTVKPGESLESEPLLFATGSDYHAHLEAYGAAIAKVNHPRAVGRAPSGWWSWTSYYAGVTDGLVRTNAQWLAENLKTYGYNYVLVDEGYQYARGEYVSTDAMHFPEGMVGVGRFVTKQGINFGVWTAPFEVSLRSWVYEHHKDWLVHNAAGDPIRILQPEIEELYALDPTNPGAQDYLRETYRTLTHDWNVRYIKLDFMDDTAIEGVHYATNVTAIEAQRIGLKVIREAVGEDVQLDKDGSAMLAPVGLVDEGRISTDTGHSFEPSKTAASGIAERYYMNRNFFVADPDAFTLTDQKGEGDAPGTTVSEAEVSIVLAAIAGAMFEVGDDLPMLGSEPERAPYARNADLLAMYKCGHAATPVDLMSYDDADEQPSVFVLHEGSCQTMLAVFNWTDQPRSHRLAAAQLGLAPAGKYAAIDALHAASASGDAPAPESGLAFDSLAALAKLQNQPPHSVRLIKIIDVGVAPAPPAFDLSVLSSAEAGKPVKVTVTSNDAANPAIDFAWDFGDGTTETGHAVYGVGDAATHTYTHAGTFTVTVTVTGVDGQSSKKSAMITIPSNTSPDFHFDQNRRAPKP
jgi:alpha-galactosidase